SATIVVRSSVPSKCRRNSRGYPLSRMTLINGESAEIFTRRIRYLANAGWQPGVTPGSRESVPEGLTVVSLMLSGHPRSLLYFLSYSRRYSYVELSHDFC